jgi:hypothetical protein
MTKSIKTGTVLDTHEIDLATVERVGINDKLHDDLAEVRAKLNHEIRAALIRRAKPGEPPSPRAKLRAAMTRTNPNDVISDRRDRGLRDDGRKA